MAFIGFNADEYESNTFAPIPAGEYVACVIDSDVKPTRNGTGKYLELTIKVLEGEYAGQLLWARLNIENRSEVAQKIARQQLADLCRAVNVTRPQDSAELHQIPFVAKVVVKEFDGNYSNEVKSFKPLQKAEAAKQPASSADDTPPWQR